MILLETVFNEVLECITENNGVLTNNTAVNFDWDNSERWKSSCDEVEYKFETEEGIKCNIIFDWYAEGSDTEPDYIDCEVLFFQYGGNVIQLSTLQQERTNSAAQSIVKVPIVSWEEYERDFIEYLKEIGRD